jgi:adenylosuccinate lyase
MIPRYSRKEMTELWSDQSRFELWLEIEILAMEAMVEEGIVPRTALDNVKAKGNFNAQKVLEIEEEVKHDVIAFLTNVAEYVGEDARWLHWGMTSSDLLDTTFAVQLCRATDRILSGLDLLLKAVETRAFEHKTTLCIGRSHGIHAEPITFGLKLANWHSELARQKERIIFARCDIAMGAISGPVGTFAHLSPKIEEYVCKKMGLAPAPSSTQVISRDSHAALFNAFAGLATTIERIAVEIRHLQRTEVREAEEFFSKGQKGSSAMPHKRNPILTENLSGLARLVRSWATASYENIALWHERDISHSSVERVIAPDITITIDFMLARATSVVSKLQIYSENMRRNLELTGGLYHSATLLVELAAKGLAREEAYKVVQSNAMATWDELNSGVDSSKVKTFPERVREDAKVLQYLTKDEIEKCCSLNRHTQYVDYIFQRVFGRTQ